MIKAIIFDLDGVIVDSEPLHFEAHQKALREFGFDISLQEYLDFGVATGDSHLYEKIIKKYSNENIPTKDIHARKKEIYKRLAEEKLELREKIREQLSELKGNYVLALASSGERETVHFVLNKFNLEDYFQTLITGNDVGRVKPHPEIYLKAIEGLGLMKSECIAIEDSQTGLQAAKAAGLKCIAVPCEFTRTQDFSSADLLLEKIEHITIERIEKI